MIPLSRYELDAYATDVAHVRDDYQAEVNAGNDDPHIAFRVNALQAAVDALRCAPEDEGWQPIETAPKDCGWVLLCDANGKRGFGHRHYVGDWWNIYPSGIGQPTVWRPLPPAPGGDRP